MAKSASLTDASMAPRARPEPAAPLNAHPQNPARHVEPDAMRDYLVREDGETFAGRHYLIDFWDADHLNDGSAIEDAMNEAARAAGATILHSHVHEFGPGEGVSGVVVLAESHISVHTWPEIGYAAFDIFMCGDCHPEPAVEALKARLRPGRTEVSRERRGRIRS